MPPHWTLHEHGRHRAQGLEFSMQPPRRKDDKSVDIVSEHLRCPHLLLGMLPGVSQEHLQIEIPSRPLEGADHGRKVRIRDVGHDDRDHAGPSRLHFAGSPIGGESETGDRSFYPASRFGRHLLRSTQRTRHRRGMHPGFGRHVENGDASGLSHETSRYSPAVERLRDSPSPAAGHARRQRVLGAAPSGWGCCRPGSRGLDVSIRSRREASLRRSCPMGQRP